MDRTMQLDLWRSPSRDGSCPVGDAGSVAPAPRAAPRVERCPGTTRSSGSGTGAPRAAAGGPGPARGVGSGRAASRPVPSPPPSRDAVALLRQAVGQLGEARLDPEPVRRYPAAYLAALRAGAAVLAMRARPRPRRGAPRDVWRLLSEVAPELEEWSSFFASCSRVREAAEAGIDRLVDQRGADDLLRQAEQFVARVRLMLPR